MTLQQRLDHLSSLAADAKALAHRLHEKGRDDLVPHVVRKYTQYEEQVFIDRLFHCRSAKDPNKVVDRPLYTSSQPFRRVARVFVVAAGGIIQEVRRAP
jgi:hypothetical protein